MRHRFLSPCAVAAILAAAPPAPALAAAPHPFSIHDMLAMERLSDFQVSPDGSAVAFTLRTTDLEANKGRTDIYLVGIDGSGLRKLTTHADADTSPRFSPDGKSIFFLSTRSGSSQVHRLELAGGEPSRVTDFPLDVNAFVLSPDGSHLAVAMEVFPGLDAAASAKRVADTAANKASGMVFDKLFVRHWDSWKDGRRSHVFVTKSDGSSGASAVDVMKAMDADSPSKPFGGAEEIAFSPDGREVIFVARDAGREEAWSTDFDLYAAPIDGSAPPRCLTDANAAWDTAPVFSPDGKTLAYLAMSRPGYEADRFKIVLQPWPAGASKVLAESWDRSPGSISWSDDGKSIIAEAGNLGHTALFSIDVESGAVRTLVSDGTVRSPQPGPNGIVFGLDHLRSPVEIHTIGYDGKGMKAITSINADRVAAVKMGEPEQFTFPGWNGETVHAWIVKPADFDPSKKYPVAFLIHGGPQGSFGNDFHYRWNPQAYAGAGYAAVMVDFHGSTGYGQAFCDSIRGDWGGKPLEDLRKGLDAALERYPFMDGKRVAALGASYGGYMINWIAGQWPDRFACLVCHDGNLDERMAYFDTEELWFPEWDHVGTPWENPDGYRKHNPIDHVQKWKTPTLVIHGAKDYRVVDTQGLSTFTALQRRGVPSRLLYFPDENHWVLKPANSILWHETVLEWLARWTKDGGA